MNQRLLARDALDLWRCTFRADAEFVHRAPGTRQCRPVRIGVVCHRHAAVMIDVLLSMRGGTICKLDFVMAGQGSIIKLKPATRIKRRVWVSGEFKRRHPALSDLIYDGIAKSQWRALPTRASYLAAHWAEKAKGKKGRQAEIIALVANVEKTDDEDTCDLCMWANGPDISLSPISPS